MATAADEKSAASGISWHTNGRSSKIEQSVYFSRECVRYTLLEHLYNSD